MISVSDITCPPARLFSGGDPGNRLLILHGHSQVNLTYGISLVNMAATSALIDGGVNHDTVTRFLSDEDLDFRALWRLVKPLVRELEWTARRGDGGPSRSV